MRALILSFLLFAAAPARAQDEPLPGPAAPARALPSPLLGVPFDAGSGAWVVGYARDAVHQRIGLGFEVPRAGGWFCASMALALAIAPAAGEADAAGLRAVDRLHPQAALGLGYVGDHELGALGPVRVALAPVLRVAADAAAPLDDRLLPYRLRAEGGLAAEARTDAVRVAVGALYDRDLTGLVHAPAGQAATLRLGASLAYAVPEEVLVTRQEADRRVLERQAMTTLLRASLTWDRPLEGAADRDGLLLALSVAY